MGPYEISPELDRLAKTDPQVAARVRNTHAAIAALRANPLNMSLVQDSDAPITVENQLPRLPNGQRPGGTYDPPTNQIRLAADRRDVSQNSLYHEMLHSLQHKKYSPLFDPYRDRNNPETVLNLGKGTGNRNMMVGNMETPAMFAERLKQLQIDYGPGEAAAIMASQMNQGTKGQWQSVKDIQKEFPILSTMYAQQVSQPNRPRGAHYKGEPEWSGMDKLRNTLYGYQPELDIEQYVEGAKTLSQIRALRNRGGNDGLP